MKEVKDVNMHIRLTSDEYNTIKHLAAHLGLTATETVRRKILNRGANLSEISTANYNKEKLLVAKSLKSDFKKLVEKFNEISKKHSLVLEGISTGKQDAENSRRTVSMLNSVLVDIQKSLNAILEKLDATEMHIVAGAPSEKIRETPGQSVTSVKRNLTKLLNLYNMQKSIISGIVKGEAKKFTSQKSNSERIGFYVVCTENGFETKYEVTCLFDEKTFASLTDGKRVFVVGDFGFSRREQEGRIYTTLRISADTVETCD